MNSLTPTYARTATMNLFALFEGTAPGDLVTVETTDGRTFEGELVEAEVKLARESFGIEDNGLVVTFERADGHRMRVSQYSDGVRVRTEFDDPHTSYESFRDLNGSPGVENVGVEQADEDLGEPETPGEDEFDDDEPRETCGDCGGEAVHVATRRTNAWINEASAYDSHLFECLDCGRTGNRTENGDRTGAVAAPADEAEARVLTDGGVDDPANEYHERADALDALARRLSNADSVADEVPELAELFHKARTSRRKSRDGRYVALLDLVDGSFECRSVAFLEQGTHYRDTGADASVSFSPYPFLSVDLFAEAVADDLRRDARAARQTAASIDEHRRREQ